MLRNYQNECLLAIQKASKNGVVVLPTGSGKTVIFTEIIKKNPVANFLILTDRKILIDQTKKYLTACENFEICTRQKLQRIETEQLIKSLSKFNYCFVDEAHTVNFSTGGYKKIIECLPSSCRIVGFTATPYRRDNGSIVGENKIFKEIIYRQEYKALQDQGFLSKIEYYVNIYDDPEMVKVAESAKTDNDYYKVIIKPVYLDSILETIEKYEIKNGVIYALNIDHGQKIKDLMQKNNFNVDIIHSQDSKHTGSGISSLKNGDVDFLVNVQILTTGFDFPGLQNIIIARPTSSQSLWHQMCGRVSRITSNKNVGKIYDIASNFNKFGGLDQSHISINYATKSVIKILREIEEEKERSEKVYLETQARAKLLLAGDNKYSIFTSLSLSHAYPTYSRNGKPMVKLCFIHNYDTNNKLFKYKEFGIFITRCGKDWYFGARQDLEKIQEKLNITSWHYDLNACTTEEIADAINLKCKYKNIDFDVLADVSNKNFVSLKIA